MQCKGLPVSAVNKVAQGRPHIVDRLLDGEVDVVFNTTEGWQSLKDSHSIRATALRKQGAVFHHGGRQPRGRTVDRGGARARA